MRVTNMLGAVVENLFMCCALAKNILMHWHNLHSLCKRHK